MSARLVLRRVVPIIKQSVTPAIAAGRSRRYHGSPLLYKASNKTTHRTHENDPIVESMRRSTSPSGDNTKVVSGEEAKHAAFLGEADSDDAFEADFDINPEAHQHKFSDVNASGLHGQSGEGDEPIERERKPQEAIDASQSAFLGESDSDDGYESHRELYPEQYRHKIDDARSSGMHGESGEGDEPFEWERK